jgi:phosphatidate cytidylyltransferase
MLKKRIIAALWGIPLLIAVISFGEPWFSAIVAACGLLALFEFYRLIAATKMPPMTYFGLVWALLFIISPHFEYFFYVPLLLTTMVILPLIWLLFYPNREQAFTRWAWTIAGIIYIGWLLSHLVALRGLADGKGWVFFALFTNFASDTGAFFIGKAMGRHHLFPSISPGKTWEGAIGGIFSAFAASLLLVFIFNLPLSYWQAILLGLAISIFGQLGDLVESLFKRNTGVKEASHILPGHGGMLDRIDSVVFSVIVVYYYVVWVIL